MRQQKRSRQAFVSMAIMLLASAGAGCERLAPPLPPPEGGSGLPPAYTRSEISDPGVREVATKFRNSVLSQTAAPSAEPIFSRVEVLPITQTTLPYGVGAYQQEPRLPVIVTTGPGWSALPRDQKEQRVAGLYADLADRLRRATPGKELRPTLTVQTPQGLLLAWVNDLQPGRRLLHGDAD